ncbi:MAG: efflux RND transporter permease subunit [Thermoguttaceae bacterium]
MTTILVFVPLAFVHGVIGQFFQFLSIALSIALLVSMVVSLTLVPVLAARYLARRRMPTTGPIYDRLVNGYEFLLRIGLRFPRWTIALALMAVLPGWWLFDHVQTGFMPAMDEGAFVLDYWMPVGTSLASAIFALWITGTPLNVSSFMGAILLIGLDVKNGIILIEYIGQLRKEGQTLNEALIHAGRRRFRPILMTSLCTIFGLAPLALGLGPGAQMQQPLAIAVIGGLIANMLLTRLLIPVGYLVLQRSPL